MYVIMGIMCVYAIMSVIIIFTILRIIVCFQGWDKGTLEGLGTSVRHSRSWEQEQYSCIPDWIGRDNESSIIDTRGPYHDEVQSMTAMERFRRKRIAVYSLHSLVLVVSYHQTIEQSKMPLCWADSCSSNVLRRASTCKIMSIKCIICIIQN